MLSNSKREGKQIQSIVDSDLLLTGVGLDWLLMHASLSVPSR